MAAEQAGPALHDGAIARDPCSRRTSPGAGRQRPYVATTDQVWALHDAVPEHLRSAVLLVAFAHLWPDTEESTRAAVDLVLAVRADSLRTRRTS